MCPKLSYDNLGKLRCGTSRVVEDASSIAGPATLLPSLVFCNVVKGMM